MAETVTPTGPRGKAKVNLRDMIAASSTFQTATGVETAAAAKAFLHLTDYTGGATFTRPFGLIVNTGNDSTDRESLNSSVTSGDFEIRLEQDIDDDYKDTPDDAELTFENFYEGVIADLLDLAGVAGWLIINDIKKIEGPTQFETNGGTYFYGVRLLVSWGLQ